MVLNYPDKLFMGWNRSEEVDEIRHEEIGDSRFGMEWNWLGRLQLIKMWFLH